MPQFSYTVKNELGKVSEGEIKASNEEEARQVILQKGYAILEIKKKNPFSAIGGLNIFKSKAKVKDVSLFCRQFAIILDAGVPLSSSLDVLREQITNPAMLEAVNGVYEGVQKGKPLSKSMAQYTHIFPPILISMVESGEVTGQLDKVFLRMADQFEKDYRLQKKIRGAMIYPVIVLLISVLVIFILMTKVLPIFKTVLDGMGVELPTITKMVMGTSDFFVEYAFFIIIGLLGVGGTLVYFSRTPAGKWFMSRMALHIPVIKGVTKNVMSARFSRTLSSLISSGVLLIESIEVTQRVMGNLVVVKMLDSLLEDIKMGKGLSVPMRELQYFPPMLVSMIRIGEESGELDKSLSKSADYYEGEVETSIQQMTTFIEPAVILGLAVVIGTIVISILLPMMKIYDKLSQ